MRVGAGKTLTSHSEVAGASRGSCWEDIAISVDAGKHSSRIPSETCPEGICQVATLRQVR